MSETPRDALERFITEMQKVQSVFEPLHQNPVDALTDGATALRPFLANPDRYEQTLRIMLEGIANNYATAGIFRAIPILRWHWYKRLSQIVTPQVQRIFESQKRDYLNKLAIARDDLLKSLTPGRLEIDILPPKVKAADQPKFNLVEFQLNVDVSPAPEFTTEALSVRLEAMEPDVQFSTVSPSTRVESSGSYEDTDTANVKEGFGRKSTGKIGFEVGGTALGAKAGSELTDEETGSYEYQLTTSRKRSGQQFTPLVIGSAIKGVASWTLLANAQQPLRGGLAFFATAYVPAPLTHVNIAAEVEARLRDFGVYRVTEQKKIELLLPQGEKKASSART